MQIEDRRLLGKQYVLGVPEAVRQSDWSARWFAGLDQPKM